MRVISSTRIVTWLYGALLALVPVVMYPRTSELFEFNKMLVIYLITGLLISFWVARMILEKSWIVRKTVFMIPMVLLLCAHIISTIFSIDVQTSIFGYYGRFNGGLLSILAYISLLYGYVSLIDTHSRSRIRESILKLLKVSIAASVVVMTWGLPSHFGYDLSCLVFTGNLNVECWTDQFKPTIRIFSTLGQPNWFAAYLAIHMCIGLYFYMRASVMRWRILWGLYLMSAWGMLLFTRSRSGLLALVCGVGLMGIYYIVRQKVFSSRAQRISIGLLICVFISMLGVIGTGLQSIDRYLHVPSILGSMNEAKQQPAISEPTPNITGSGDIRRIVWQGATAVGLMHPLIGTGVETFAYAYNFQRPVAHNMTSEWEFVYNKAHNEFLNYFATMGFMGLSVYIILCASVLLHVRKAFDNSLNKKDEEIIMMLCGAYVTILVTNFFGFSTTSIQLFCYLIPAWIALIAYGPTMKKYNDDVKLESATAIRMVIPACIAMLTLWFVIQYFRADTAYAYGNGLMGTHSYAQAVPYLNKAYGIRQEHVYADKLSQVYAQLALLSELTEGDGAMCTDGSGATVNCIEMSDAFSTIARDGSPFNPMYYRTRARNTFVFYQITQDEGHYNEALKALTEGQALAPTDPRFSFLRALFALGRYELIESPKQRDKDELASAGLSSIEFALKLKSDYTAAYYIKGLIQKALGDIEGARRSFHYIIDSLDPNHAQALQELEAL